MEQDEMITSLRKQVVALLFLAALSTLGFVTTTVKLINARKDRRALEFYYHAALISWTKREMPNMQIPELIQLESAVNNSMPRIFNFGQSNQTLDFGFKKVNGEWKTGYSTEK